MKNYLILLVLLFSIKTVSAQKALNTAVSSDGTKLIITYDLIGVSKNIKVNIKVGLIVKGKIDYEILKPKGHVGSIESVPGPKTIICFPENADIRPNADDIKIEVEWTTTVPILHVISFSGSSISPIGLKYQILGQHGFYLSGKTLNFNFNSPIGNSLELDKVRVTPEPPYKYNKAVRQIYSFSAGYSKIIKPATYIYGGLGLSIDRTLWHLIDLDGNLMPTNNTYWVEYKKNIDDNQFKVLFELGTYIKLRRLVFDIGIGYSTNKNIFFNTGIGLIIGKNKIHS